MSTVEISAADVFKLRKQTGAGMMDCKKALAEANGDFEQAIDILRKQGQKLANKRADREASEGYAFGHTSNGKAYITVLNCETDFVAKNETFGQLTQQFAQIAEANQVADLEALLASKFDDKITVSEKIIEQTGVIGEKLEISHFSVIAGASVYAYNHPGNQVVATIAFNKEVSEEIAKNVSMQIAAMAPVSISKDDCSAEIIEKELEIARDITRQEGKPEEMVEKIAQGKLNKFFKESTLLSQDFIKDSKKSVQQYLQEQDKELIVLAFKRFSMS
jgi:elongation factor Ts